MMMNKIDDKISVKNRRIDFLKRNLRSYVFKDKSILEFGDQCLYNEKSLFHFSVLNHIDNDKRSDDNYLNNKNYDTIIVWSSNLQILESNIIKLLYENDWTKTCYIIFELNNEEERSGEYKNKYESFVKLVYHFQNLNFTCSEITDSHTNGLVTYMILKNTNMVHLGHPIRDRTDRLALYFSGRIKTYEDQLTSLKSFQEYYDIDFFCSINGVKDEQHDRFLDDMSIIDSFFEEHSHIYDKTWAQRFWRLPTQNDRDAYKLSSSLYNNKKAIELVEKHQEEYQFKYDIVIKYRSDIISSTILPIIAVNFIESNSIYIPNGYDWDFYDQQGINDHIAYGSFESMKIYSNVFDNVELYCGDIHKHGYHPESLLLYHLQQYKLSIHRFQYEYGHNTNRHEPGEYG